MPKQTLNPKLELWRKIVIQVMGKMMVVKKTNPKYRIIKAMYDKMLKGK
jgi:hypothetical protein